MNQRDFDVHKVEVPYVDDGEVEIRVISRGGADKEKGHAPWLTFGIFKTNTSQKEDTQVGSINLRLGNVKTNFGLKFGGQIGYSVAQNYRGNRYAAKGCKLVFQVAKRVFKFGELYITCSVDNIASKRTCEIIGCVLVETVQVDPEHDLFKRGTKKIHVFKKIL